MSRVRVPFASRSPFHVLEYRHGLADVINSGAVVTVQRGVLTPPTGIVLRALRNFFVAAVPSPSPPRRSPSPPRRSPSSKLADFVTAVPSPAGSRRAAERRRAASPQTDGPTPPSPRPCRRSSREGYALKSEGRRALGPRRRPPWPSPRRRPSGPTTASRRAEVPSGVELRPRRPDGGYGGARRRRGARGVPRVDGYVRDRRETRGASTGYNRRRIASRKVSQDRLAAGPWPRSDACARDLGRPSGLCCCWVVRWRRRCRPI